MEEYKRSGKCERDNNTIIKFTLFALLVGSVALNLNYYVLVEELLDQSWKEAHEHHDTLDILEDVIDQYEACVEQLTVPAVLEDLIG